MKKKKTHNNDLHESNLFILAIITFILIFILYFIHLKKRKLKELQEVKEKIEKNKELLFRLQQREKKILLRIRIFIIFVYFITVGRFLYYNQGDVGMVVDYTSVGLIFFSAISFIVFGSFEEYRKWWILVETRVQIYIYRHSPDIKKELEKDRQYKDQLENEIQDINLLFNGKV